MVMNSVNPSLVHYGMNRYVFRLDSRRRIEIRKIGNDSILFKIMRKNRATGEGNAQSYLFRMKDMGEDEESDLKRIMTNVNMLADMIKLKTDRGDQDEKWKKKLNFYLMILGQSSMADKHLKRIYEREGIAYRKEELPRIKRLVIRLFTIPEPEHVIAKAVEKKISLKPDDVPKICWGIHAFQHALDEIREGKRIY
jgi:hypothetical protein